MANKIGNSLKTARKITLTGIATTFKDSLNRKNKDDFYSFQLTGSSNFNLTLTGLKANADVALLNQSGKSIVKSARPKKQNESLSLTLNAATYYIRVSLKDKAKTKYRLLASAIPTMVTDHNQDHGPGLISNLKFQRLWLKQFGTASVDRALAVVTGSNQEVYVAGSTQGVLGNRNQGELDAYVAKYNSAGDLQWRKQLGTTQNDEIYDLTVDRANNLYTTGVQKLPSKSNLPIFADGFLVKYSDDGNFLFAQDIGAGNRNDELGLGIALSSDGNLYVVGQVTSSTGFFTVNIDPFIAKYSSSGTLISQIPIDLTNQGTAISVTVDAQGNIYVTGITNASARTDPTTLVTTLTEGDVFVTKYNSSGQSLWFKAIETNETDIPGKVLVDASGNIYVAGSTSGSLPGNTNKGDIDAFLAKYSNDGNLQWLKQFGTSAKDTVESIALDMTGRIYAAGTTGGSLFGDAVTGGSDAWIALFDNSGNRITNTQFGTVKDDRLLDIALNKTGNLVLVGETEGELGSTNQGSVDAWVAQYTLVTS